MRGALVDRCDNCGALMRPMQAEQHRAVEAVYQDLSDQQDWPVGSGEMLEAWEWHQLMVHAYAKASGWHPKVLPSLDGGGVTMVIRQKQSRLTVKQGAELTHFARAWAIDHGVILKEPTCG